MVGEAADRDSRHKDAARYKAKYEEDADRDSRHRDSRSREDRHKDEYALRDHHSDRSGSKHANDESYAVESRYKKSRYDDGEQTRYNDDRGSRGWTMIIVHPEVRHVDPEKNNGGDTVFHDDRRNRADDIEDQAYCISTSTKEQHVDPEKNDGGYTRYKDDRGNRADDREDQNFSRSRSTKERHVDPEKNAGEFTRYNDDRGNRADDREDRSYSRSRSTKEQHFDPEKKVSVMAESIADKKGSRLHHADADLNASCNRQRNSPSSHSHLSKDQSRPSIQAELKYGEPEERVRQNFLPSKEVVDVSGVLEQPCLSKRTKRLFDKDDSSFGDLSVERDLISDESKPSTSPLDLPDDSKLTRSTWDNYDSKKFGKSSGVKDTGSSCVEGKGSWQLPSKKLPVGRKF
ncbi:pre-mRNA-splicing factor cwc25-like [Rosa rugosa]|uniref:pre-mRNA-splicing factor cwc25-like n=1 Tax=Rosa rugosa TaxID=74645 RepID=UPI002B408B53|nr:pre-mRNA-splicing factor cwc25-like [Rosa rugosa]